MQHSFSATPTGNTTEVRLTFAGLPDGPAPRTFGSGPATVRTNPPSDPGTSLRIEAGRLTSNPTVDGVAASYYTTADLGGPVVNIGARWTFIPRGNSSGAMALIVSKTAFDLPFSVHFVVSAEIWSFGVWPPSGPGSSLVVLGGGKFASPLIEDGTKVYKAQLWVIGDQALIQLPDGGGQLVKDSRIAEWAGAFATFETYANQGDKDSRVAFTEVWAKGRKP